MTAAAVLARAAVAQVPPRQPRQPLLLRSSPLHPLHPLPLPLPSPMPPPRSSLPQVRDRAAVAGAPPLCAHARARVCVCVRALIGAWSAACACVSLDGEAIVTPWDVDGGEGGIDYDKLVVRFGCVRISEDIVSRVERLTGRRAHRFLRRGYFYTHRLAVSCLRVCFPATGRDGVVCVCVCVCPAPCLGAAIWRWCWTASSVARSSSCTRAEARRQRRCTWGTSFPSSSRCTCRCALQRAVLHLRARR